MSILHFNEMQASAKQVREWSIIDFRPRSLNKLGAFGPDVTNLQFQLICSFSLSFNTIFHFLKLKLVLICKFLWLSTLTSNESENGIESSGLFS